MKPAVFQNSLIPTPTHDFPGPLPLYSVPSYTLFDPILLHPIQNQHFEICKSDSCFVIIVAHENCTTLQIPFNILLLLSIPILLTSLCCMLCFSNTGHVIILQRTVSFKFWLIHVHTCLCIMYEKTEGQFPRDLYLQA